MTKWLEQHQYGPPRRSNSSRGCAGGGAAPLDGGAMSEGGPLFKTPAAIFWLALHGICCLISLVLGFRFSRLVFFLLFSSPASNTYSPSTTTLLHAVATTSVAGGGIAGLDAPAPPLTENRTASRVGVGRRGIRIRPWPHPNPTEVMTAHGIIERVQREQRAQYGVKNPRPLIAVTPTYVRTFQALHLTGLMHSLMLLPYDLIWIVVEAGGMSNETAALLARSKLRTVHVPFDSRMPVEWADRHKLEARMRLRALRVVREQRLDGIVVFADDSNMHSTEMFDEIQKVNWFGALSVGILAHSGNSDATQQQLVQQNDARKEKENLLMPIQGPACNSSGKLVGWHTFNTLPYSGNRATFVGDVGTVLPNTLEWAGFVLNSRLVWKDTEDKPDWVIDLDSLVDNEEGIESPLVLLKDASFVEPLGNCGRKVMLWWLRVEARSDSKFPPGWIIDPPLEIIVPAKRTPWPDVPPELPSGKATMLPGIMEKHLKARSSRSRRSSRGKRRHDSSGDTQVAGVSQSHIQER